MLTPPKLLFLEPFSEMRHLFRNIILGKGKFIEDYSTYMRAMLHGYLVLLAIVIGICFILMDTFIFRRTEGNLQYVIIILFSSGTLYLTRSGYYTIAAVLQVMLVNAVVFYFTFYDQRDGY